MSADSELMLQACGCGGPESAFISPALSHRHVSPYNNRCLLGRSPSQPASQHRQAKFSSRARFPLPWWWRHAAAPGGTAQSRAVGRARQRALQRSHSSSAIQPDSRASREGQDRAASQKPEPVVSLLSSAPLQQQQQQLSVRLPTPQRQYAWDSAPAGRAVREPDWSKGMKTHKHPSAVCRPVNCGRVYSRLFSFAVYVSTVKRPCCPREILNRST